MCGVVGIVSTGPVNQMLYDALLLLQHRGQDAAGIATAQGKRIFMSRGTGLVRDVFRTRDMRNLFGEMGIGHVRYPTAGSAMSAEEAQPFYVNAPFGIVLGHNGILPMRPNCKTICTVVTDDILIPSPTRKSCSMCLPTNCNGL